MARNQIVVAAVVAAILLPASASADVNQYGNRLDATQWKVGFDGSAETLHHDGEVVTVEVAATEAANITFAAAGDPEFTENLWIEVTRPDGAVVTEGNVAEAIPARVLSLTTPVAGTYSLRIRVRAQSRWGGLRPAPFVGSIVLALPPKAAAPATPATAKAKPRRARACTTRKARRTKRCRARARR